MRFSKTFKVAVLFLALVYSLPILADARDWKPTPQAIINDYSIITHQRSPLEYVMLGWSVAEKELNPSPQTVQLLSKYMIIGIVHMTVTQLGEMRFQTPVNVRVQLEGRKVREPIDRANLPPAAIGFLSMFETALSKGLGPLGQGIHSFVFDSTDIAACGEGKVWVYYAGERYLYELPFPGCDQLRSTPPN